MATKEEHKSSSLTVRFTPTARAQIKALADEEALSPAQWVRKEIMLVLRQKEEK